MTKPCTNTTCGSYNPSLKNNCRHGFTDFKTFDCLGYVAEKDKGMTKNTAPCCNKGCDRYSDQEHLNCKASLGLVMYGCRKYEPAKETQHSYDKIIDRMEGEVPKNGK